VASEDRNSSDRRHRTPLILAVVATIVVSSAVLALFAYVGFQYVLQNPRPAIQTRVTQLFDLFKIALAVVGGLGGAVALVVAYRRQGIAEDTQTRERLQSFNERFNAAVEQLGNAAAPIRLGGVYSLVSLADEWPAERQRCTNVLCGYLRFPVDAESTGEDQIRRAIAREIRDRLRGFHSWDTTTTYFDLTGARLDSLDLSGIHLRSTTLILRDCRISSDFSLARTYIDGGTLDATGLEISGGNVDLSDMRFLRGHVSFENAKFLDGDIRFGRAVVKGCRLSFDGSEFAGGRVAFDHLSLDLRKKGESPERLSISRAKFSGGALRFGWIDAHRNNIAEPGNLSELIDDFMDREPEEMASRDTLSMQRLELSGGSIEFRGICKHVKLDLSALEISGGCVDFSGVVLRESEVILSKLSMSGGKLDFRHAQIGSTGPDLSSWVYELPEQISQAQKDGRDQPTWLGIYEGHPEPVISTQDGGAQVSGGLIDFSSAKLERALIDFSRLQFVGGRIVFDDLRTTYADKSSVLSLYMCYMEEGCVIENNGSGVMKLLVLLDRNPFTAFSGRFSASENTELVHLR
jgi:hypothetical protein